VDTGQRALIVAASVARRAGYRGGCIAVAASSPSLAMSNCRRASLTLLLVLLLGACTSRTEPAEHVTHEERALAKAHAAWASLFVQRADETFSPGNIQRFAPYQATLEDGVWIVRGTIPADFHGSMPEARIRADDGETRVRSIESETTR
jgi:hypothetical protein